MSTTTAMAAPAPRKSSPQAGALTDETDFHDYRTVELRKGKKGFGINLRSKNNYFVHVSSIAPDSPAQGTALRVNDLLVAINGRPVVQASHDEVLALFRQAADTLLLKVCATGGARKHHPERSTARPRGSKDVAPDEKKEEDAEKKTEAKKEATRDASKDKDLVKPKSATAHAQEVQLRRRPNVGFGFVLEPVAGGLGAMVAEVDVQGAAFEVLRPGDLILEIDGEPVTLLPTKDIREALQYAQAIHVRFERPASREF